MLGMGCGQRVLHSTPLATYRPLCLLCPLSSFPVDTLGRLRLFSKACIFLLRGFYALLIQPSCFLRPASSQAFLKGTSGQDRPLSLYTGQKELWAGAGWLRAASAGSNLSCDFPRQVGGSVQQSWALQGENRTEQICRAFPGGLQCWGRPLTWVLRAPCPSVALSGSLCL